MSSALEPPAPPRTAVGAHRWRWRAAAPPTAGDLPASAWRPALFAAYDLSRDRLYGHVKPRKRRGEFLTFPRYVRTLYPPEVRIGIVLDNDSPHLSTRDDPKVGDWARAHNVELAYVPTNASWLNRIEAQFAALRYVALDGTDRACHTEQGLMIRHDLAWRNRHARDQRFRAVVGRANVA